MKDGDLDIAVKAWNTRHHSVDANKMIPSILPLDEKEEMKREVVKNYEVKLLRGDGKVIESLTITIGALFDLYAKDLGYVIIPPLPSVEAIEKVMADRLKIINPNFDGIIFITDNYHTPPNNWTKVSLPVLAHAAFQLMTNGNWEK